MSKAAQTYLRDLQQLLAPSAEMDRYVRELVARDPLIEQAIQQQHHYDSRLWALGGSAFGNRVWREGVLEARLLREQITRAATDADQLAALMTYVDPLKQIREIVDRLDAESEALRVARALHDAITSSASSTALAWMEIPKLAEMNLATAKQLAALLGEQGLVQGEIDRLIRPEREGIEAEPASDGRKRQLDLSHLLSFILALVILLYEEQSAHQMEARLTARIDSIKITSEQLALGIERALAEERKRQDTRYSVRDRAATVRTDPIPGAKVLASLFPRETVRLVGERGRWIQIEFYNWRTQEYATGWVLKKYFIRIPPSPR